MKLVKVGSTLLVIPIIMAFIGRLYPTDWYTKMNMTEKFQSPSVQHLLGTDQFGRDILARLMVASESALFVGIGSVLIGLLMGCLLGALAGYYQGAFGNVVMRMMDGIFAFPNLLLALMIVTVLGAGETKALVAIAIFNIPLFARLMYGFILEAHQFGYVKAAYTYGASPVRILFLHMVPAALPKIFVQATTSMGTAILTEAALSFLGLGVQPPKPSWGGMLDEAQNYLGIAPWYPIFPGICLLITVLGLNLIGDGLRDRGQKGAV